jgi:hypothetical protein
MANPEEAQEAETEELPIWGEAISLYGIIELANGLRDMTVAELVKIIKGEL